jgi:hypothetical protein
LRAARRLLLGSFKRRCGVLPVRLVMLSMVRLPHDNASLSTL